jgi:amino acid transporter
MGRENVMPAALARVGETRRTPWLAIAASTALAAVLASTGDLESLADTTVLLLLGVFVVVNVVVLVLRRDRVGHDHFRVPTALPVLGVAASALVMTQSEPDAWARAGALLALALVLWSLDRHLAGRSGGEK